MKNNNLKERKNSKTKRNLKEKGITLIALVVTLIILLILAGVTVSLVVGQNGLLQRAQTASNTMANATANELAQMGQYSSDIDTLTSEFIDNSKSIGFKLKVGEIDLSTAVENFKTGEALKEYYGETTNFTSVEGVKWQLFYDDEDYYYVIASDYVPVATMINAKELTSGSYNPTYCAKFATHKDGTYTGEIISNYIGSADIANNKFTQKYLKWPLNSNYSTSEAENIKATAYMMDISNWSNFAGNEVIRTGGFAIGGATIELFAKSYNAYENHTIKLGTYDSLVIGGEDANVNEYGYKAKIGNLPWGVSWASLDTTKGNGDEGGNMWVRTSSSKAIFMFLASPSPSSNGGTTTLCGVDCYSAAIGGITQIDNGASGFRPIVVIPK